MSRIQDVNIVEGRQKVFRVAKRSLLTAAIIIILIIAAIAIYRMISNAAVSNQLSYSQLKIEHWTQEDGTQCFKITNIPPDSLIRIPQVVCSKGDTIAFSFSRGAFYFEGREYDLKVSGPGEKNNVKLLISIGNDGPGPQDSWIGIKSGKKPPQSIMGRVIPSED